MRILFFSLLLLLTSLLPACAPAPAAEVPTPPPIPTTDPAYVSDGRGEPRSSRYWMQWSTCGEDSRADVAAANGGRAAGWFLLDDLLLDPGIGLGELALESCPQALALLSQQNIEGQNRSTDAAYGLAAQLLTAALNLAAGTESCPAAEDTYNQAQLLLAELDFDGVGGFLGPPRASGNVDMAVSLTAQLAQYNTGSLCR